jgi:hypothetical protein
MMRIDPVGIYTNKGLIQKNSHPVVNGQVPESDPACHQDYQDQGHSNRRSKPQDVQHQYARPQQVERQAKPVRRITLSKAESTRITDLFGRFDLKSVNQTDQKTPNDNRPGRIINIVV